MQPLDLNTLPLDGVRLIEASAGTGKTYTIATLYLRLLLERTLSVKQILVVTFTKAATEELRGRIRQRMREALQQLQGSKQPADPALLGILSQLNDHKTAAQQLKDALTLMDEAAIFTIHSFCQRMLTENAFESGSLFDAELITDEIDYLREIAEDFWRSHFYTMNEADAAWVAKQWKEGPSTLLEELRSALNRHELTVIPSVTTRQLEALWSQRNKLIEQVQKLWHNEAETLRPLLTQDKGLNRRTYRIDTLEKLFTAMNQFCESPYPRSLPEKIELLTASKISTSMKKGHPPLQHRFFELNDQLFAMWEKAEQLRRSLIMQQFIQYSRDTLIERKTAHNVISTNDLLTGLYDALKNDTTGLLAARIRQQYPLAMIDEFQDTDPVQYTIFHTLYHQQPACGLYMIGDPKQAIYSFRGADIFTYMQARHDSQHHYTLDTNWRSTPLLITAVNQLFSSTEKPFIYDKDIQFHPVKAAPQTTQKTLLINGKTAPPLQVWLIPRDENKEISKEVAKNRLATCCAQQIARLLNHGLAGEATLGDKALQPSDIAILVRTHREAQAVQKALRSCQIASAYISRDSVFESPEAEVMGRLLLAVSEPNNERRLRATLCDEMMGMSAQQLFELIENENRWEELLEQFQNYHILWCDHGFMSMFQALLRQQQISQNILASSGGERALSNLLQLAELLQTASKQQHGIEGLLHWYFEQLGAKSDEDERQLRLESDEALVQIVTIHKSKGLEYEVVFLPYSYGSMPRKKPKPVEYHCADSGKLILDIGSEQYQNSYDLSDTERLAEELRLLYVALTRAKQRCYIAWGAIKDADKSALAYLLYKDEIDKPNDSQILNCWQQRVQLQPDAIAVQPLPDARHAPYLGASGAAKTPQSRQFNGHIERSWQVSSFSALTSSRGHRAILPDYDATEPTSAPVKQQTKDIFTFPRGAHAGTMMHAIFENIDFSGSQGKSVAEVCEEQLIKYGFEPQWQPVIETMVNNLLNTVLDENSGLTLAQISTQQRLVELAFHFPLAHINSKKLNQVITGTTEHSDEGAALNFKPHQGIMTGFVDLIFEYQGRYYIADYKSNHLGYQLADYQPVQLKAAMQQHRYDLQYLIYTVALHRYLKTRLKNYDYETDFGGIYYLFLRGICPQQGAKSGIYYDKPKRSLIDELERIFTAKGNR
ncbi:MAG: exodeoxyribonuclease V subunit beta [Gammaproteobacteria bacterium]|nr:exodeoxyribonuclease V subunit beta [Gammaproteobacteria bacterium]